jgi:hypothetical protein
VADNGSDLAGNDPVTAIIQQLQRRIQPARRSGARALCAEKPPRCLAENVAKLAECVLLAMRDGDG